MIVWCLSIVHHVPPLLTLSLCCAAAVNWLKHELSSLADTTVHNMLSKRKTPTLSVPPSLRRTTYLSPLLSIIAWLA
jgi:hypothetical protein